jgi:hypothetical protein
MARWDKALEVVDPLVLKDIERMVDELNVEDKYFLHFLLRHFKAVKTFFQAMRDYSM